MKANQAEMSLPAPIKTFGGRWWRESIRRIRSAAILKILFRREQETAQTKM
jgi:hypothetical protein